MSKRLSRIARPTAESLIGQTGVYPKGNLEASQTRADIALRQSAGSQGWGGTAKQAHVPSGIKVLFEEDSDAILKFVGIKDISDKVGKETGDALFYTFWDGRKLVSVPGCFGMKETIFQPGFWYYLLVSALISGKNASFSPLKDFDIRELGQDNEKVQCPERVSDDKVLVLNEDIIADINYHRINYPLRKS
jgi:hypothetical protein